MPGFDITEGLIFDLSSPVATAYLPTDAAWDCAIGGVPFNFAIDKERPMSRQTAQFRRDRVDQERNPGEQSLDSGLWLRSMSSLHYGAGLRSQEELEVDAATARFRYYRSASIDPWTPGQLTLGKARPNTYSNGGSGTYLAVGSGTTTALVAANTALVSLTNAGSATAITWGGTGNIQSICVDGDNWYAGNSTSGIYKGTLPSSAGSKIWNGGGNVLIRWIKQRLIGAVGASLYELVGTGPALPTALYTHPVTGWTWTGIAEGPSSIYFAGYSGTQSAIYRSSITASGATVTLSAPLVVADMPRGEQITMIYSYLGSFLAIGTNRGLRIAAIDSSGGLSVGPLTFTCSGGVTDAVGYDKYLYVTGGSDATDLDGTTSPGIYRVDLSAETDTLRFAYAQEVAEGAAGNPAQSVTMIGSDFIHTVPAGVKYPNSSAPYATTGWIEYGKITYSTGENKAWQSVVVRGDTPTGTTIEVHASTTGTGSPSSWPVVGTLSDTATDAVFGLDAAAGSPSRELYIAVKLTGSGAATPTLRSITLRSVPAPGRTRLLQVPLMCFDIETDRLNVKRGYEGGAYARLSLLEDAEDRGSVVSWQDFTTGERRSAVIEQVSQSRVTPPSRNLLNAGGVLNVVLRLL